MVVKLIGPEAMNIVVSHLDEVTNRVQLQAKVVGARAEASLAGHRDTGNASISVTHGDVDSFVNLNDPAASSIEFGHWVGGKFENPDKPKYVPGLYILSGAASLPSTPKQGPRRSGR